MSKNFNEIVRLQSEKREEWIRDKRRETTRDCRGHMKRSTSGQFVSRVVPQEKRMSGDPLSLDRTGGERRQFLPDLRESLR